MQETYMSTIEKLDSLLQRHEHMVARLRGSDYIHKTPEAAEPVKVAKVTEAI